MLWHHEPPAWRRDGDTITISAVAGTDFWRKTHDGGIRDNGHFYYQPVRGDFTAEVHVRGDYRSQYDQAGLMLRQDETCWLKCGVEYVDGTEATTAQMAEDVTSFLAWAAEPKLEDRHRMGLGVMIFLIILSGLLYAAKRRVWSSLH